MHAQSEFIQNILNFLTNHSPNNAGIRLIRKEPQDLRQGDFSFPADLSIWKRYVLVNDSDENGILIDELSYMPKPETLKKCISSKENQIQSLIEISKNWHLQISKIILKHNRYYLGLNRLLCFEKIIEICSENKYHNAIVMNTSIELKRISDRLTNISNFRCELVEMVVRNLLTKYTYCNVLVPRPDVTIVVTYKSTCPLYDGISELKRKILCGIVKVSKNKNKIADISADQYIELD